MPNQDLSDAEVKEFAAYFTWAHANLRPQANEQTAPGCRAVSAGADSSLERIRQIPGSVCTLSHVAGGLDHAPHRRHLTFLHWLRFAADRQFPQEHRYFLVEGILGAQP